MKQPPLPLYAGAQVQRPLLQPLLFGTVLLYLFLVYSRVLDLAAPTLHIPLVLSLCIILFGALSGALWRGMASRPGLLLAAFVAWMAFASVFGIWRLNSVLTLKRFLPVCVLSWVIMALDMSSRQHRKAIAAVTLGVLVMCAITLSSNTVSVTGRLYMEDTKFANPNDVAAILCLHLPFALLLAADTRNAFLKVFWLAGAAVMLVTLAKTGSRMAVLTIAAMSLLCFLRTSLAGKARLVASLVAVCFLAVSVLPPQVLIRFATFGEQQQDVQLTEEAELASAAAASSSQARKQLVNLALAVVADRPVFGAGAGNDGEALGKEIVARSGVRYAYIVAHNSFLEAAVDGGLPAFVLYVAMVWTAARILLKVRRASWQPELRPVVRTAFALQVSLLAFAVTALFSSIVFEGRFYTLYGLIAALPPLCRAAGQPGTAPAGAPVQDPSQQHVVQPV